MSSGAEQVAGTERVAGTEQVADTQQFADGHQFIGGSYRHGHGEEAVRIDPATGAAAETLRYADETDVAAAVAAAQTAFPGWSRTTPAERSDALHRLAAELRARAGLLAAVESGQTGKSIRLATGFDVPGTIDNTVFFAGAARALDGLAAGEYAEHATSMIRREPVGVVGSIAPWNYPLQMAGWKILPASRPATPSCSSPPNSRRAPRCCSLKPQRQRACRTGWSTS